MKIRNLQNIPRKPRTKKLFIPDSPDELLLEADLSQAEGMVVAWYAEETRLIEKYKAGEDVHSFVGSIILERPISKKNKQERQMAKTVVHASNYDTSPGKITEIVLDELEVVMSKKQAERCQNIYFQNFPRIRSVFQAGIRKELESNLRILRTPVGFERKFWAPWGPELFRQAYSHYPQNVVAYVTNQGVIRISESPYSNMLLAQVHDSMLLSVPKDRLEEVAKAVKEAMTSSVLIKGRELVIPVELKVGVSWGEMEEYKV